KKVSVVFHDGRIVEGTLVSETATNVKVLVEQFGMAAEAVYEKSDILEIEVTGDGTAAEAEVEDTGEADPLDTPKSNSSTDPNATAVYCYELSGASGRRMSTSPLRDNVRDIKKHEPSYVLIKVEMDIRFRNTDVP